MFSRTLTVLTATAGFVALTALAAPARAVEIRNLADSFLPISASTVLGMTRQIDANPIVRRRYARYFHVPEARVADYLRHNLVRTRLTRAGRYTMYLVRPNGLIYPVMTTVPKGARVFTLQTRPAALLTYGDGNPIREFRQQVVTVIVIAPSTGASEATVKVLPSVENQTLAPVKVQETILPTIVLTPVYQPESPLSPAEQSPGTPAPAQSGN